MTRRFSRSSISVELTIVGVKPVFIVELWVDDHQEYEPESPGISATPGFRSTRFLAIVSWWATSRCLPPWRWS